MVKAQYVPLRIAVKLEARSPTTVGIGYYGAGELTQAQEDQIDFYYPQGSDAPAIGVTEVSDTQTLCEAWIAYAESQDDEGDDD